jgi:hypothetical protein
MYHPVDHTATTLPTLDALFFHAQDRGGKTILVDVGPHLRKAANRTKDYELRRLAPPPAVQALAAGGAQFHLSRLGTVRVWLAGKLIAAEAEADCARCRARKLDRAEFEYLNAYMAATGRRWDDPDQPDLPETAASPEAPAQIRKHLVQGLYRLVVCSLPRP